MELGGAGLAMMVSGVRTGRHGAMLVPTSNTRSIAGFDDGAHQFLAVEAHNHAGQPAPTPTTVARQKRLRNEASVQNK